MRKVVKALKQMLLVVALILVVQPVLSLNISANDCEQTIDSFVEQSGITVGKDTQISVKCYDQYDSVADKMIKRQYIDVINPLANGITERSIILLYENADGSAIPAELNYRTDKTDRSSGWLTVYRELTTTVVAQAYYSGSTTNYMLLYGVIAYWQQSGTDYITSLNVQFQAEGCLVDISTGVVSPDPMYPPYCAEIEESNPYAYIQYADYETLDSGYGLRTAGVMNGGGGLYVTITTNAGYVPPEGIYLF